MHQKPSDPLGELPLAVLGGVDPGGRGKEWVGRKGKHKIVHRVHKTIIKIK